MRTPFLQNMFHIKCEWQHHRATTSMSQPWFLAENAEAQKGNYILGLKIKTTHFYEKCFRKIGRIENLLKFKVSSN